ncbi:haloacid dehalogenase superfamily, subfamily IA, variant 3 with third motif having DD or ED [Cohaesibacter marisflavi]|uniref:Haloacid dehalogenase superfamily, subfamily IA, variant 3 with third motif having DD or ED n=1 Tax=Cohaesibacter marisflavi TaxID=655353 RepID=A0A1I5C6L0_9HYPH|nr:HAD family phosphatase [Cohaesibacter marisflavi]SFN82466.1 haloacid dehalogenase superfamily, subfamily IA, variant 3 with third motif having DD or ED [Cohaesibacter marisflavi]
MNSHPLSGTKAVIFDFDGVLVDSEPISLGELKNSFEEHGIEMEWSALVKGFLGTAPRDITTFMHEKTGRDPAGVFPEGWHNRVMARMEQGLTMISGAEALLDKLDADGIPYCIASGSSPDRLQLALSKIGQEKRFEGRSFSTEMVPNGKPAPDIFLHAAKALNVDPKDCMVVEDGIAGTVGAKAAGVGRIVGLVGGSHLNDDELRAMHGKALTEAGSDLIIKTLDDLLA